MAQPQSGKVSGESKGKTCADNARLRSRMALNWRKIHPRFSSKASKISATLTHLGADTSSPLGETTMPMVRRALRLSQ